MKALALALPLALSGCFVFNSVDIPLVPRFADYSEKTVLEDGESEGKIALVDVEGVLTDETQESLFGSRESQVVSFVEKLDLAAADPQVKAVIVRIDSPGGEVTTSDILHNELLRFKRLKKVPVVAAFMSVSASGGYYLACASDAIVAHPTTVTGSIGVISMHVSLAGLLDKIGVRVAAIKSGAKKDLGSPFRELTGEERAILQGLVDQYYERFVEVVAEGRKAKLGIDQVRALADGRVFTAQQALEAKLVDRVGYLRDAVDEAKIRAALKSAKVVMYSRRPSRLENPYSTTPSARAPAGDLEQVKSLLGFRCYYLWEPYLLGK